MPQRWRRTRDLRSFCSAHGAAICVSQDGELKVPMPSSAALAGLRLKPIPTPDDDLWEVTLRIDYTIDCMQGGVRRSRPLNPFPSEQQ